MGKHISGEPVIAPRELEPKYPSGFKIGFVDKTFIIVTLIVAAYITYIIYQDQILGLLQRNHYVWIVVTHIFSEIKSRTVLGLFYASFFGALFFVFVPLEVLFIYYNSMGYPAIAIVGLATIAVTMGLTLNYMFGWLAGKRALKFLLQDSFEKFHSWISKWGGIAIFFGSALPLPIQPVSVVIGAVKYSINKFMIIAFLGSLTKFTALVLIGDYIVQTALPWMHSLF